MKRGASRLAILMERFHVSGRDLSRLLHVDHTLISKWKNRKRRITADSPHIKKIGEYFMSLDAHRKIISKMLSEFLRDENEAGGEQVLQALCRWLADQDDDLALSKENALSAYEKAECSFHVFDSSSGRRKAVMIFLDMALKAPHGRQLYLVSQENMRWLVEDPEYLLAWKNKLSEVVAAQKRITIIHTVDRSREELAPILEQWLPLHVTGMVDSWYLPHYMDKTIKTTLFILEGESAVSGMVFDSGEDTDPAADRQYTAMYTDAYSVRHYTDLYLKLLAQCRPLLDVQSLNNPRWFFTRILMLEQQNARCIQYLHEPMPSAMSPETFHKVLEENGLDKHTADLLTERQTMMHSALLEHIGRTSQLNLYSLDWLEKSAREGVFCLSGVSMTAGRKITYSLSVFSMFLTDLAGLLEKYPKFEITLLSDHDKKLQHHTDLWIYEDLAVIAAGTGSFQTNDGIIPHAASTDEPTLVNAFFGYYQRIWESVPRVHRSAEWVVNTLQKMIAKYGGNKIEEA